MRWHLSFGAFLALSVFCACVRLHAQDAMQNSFRPEFGYAGQRQVGTSGAATPSQMTPRVGNPGIPSTVRFSQPPAYHVAADPFRYRTPEGGDDSVPLDIDVPAGIRVLGILMMGSGYTIATIQLPGDEDIFYVSEGDEILVQADSGKARAPRPSSAASPGSALAHTGAYYLKIKSISPSHVEVHPARRPDNLQIIR